MERLRAVLARAGERRGTWLPYAVILVLLAGIWLWWEDPAGQLNMERGEKQVASISPPVFSAEKDRHSENLQGHQVYNAASARRCRPLNDLFAHTTGRAVAPAEQQVAMSLPDRSGGGPATGADKAISHEKVLHETIPQACGLIRSGDICLVVLRKDNNTKACAVGDTFGGYRLLYIGDDVAGLERDGIVTEILLQKGVR